MQATLCFQPSPISKITQNYSHLNLFPFSPENPTPTEIQHQTHHQKSRNEEQEQVQVDIEEEEEEENGESDGEFTFACNVSDPSSAISADDIFENGLIRPIFPFFNSDDGASTSDLLPPPVKKVFVVTNHPPSTSLSESDSTNGASAGTYCAWSSKTATQLSPELGNKSNSTGFSKIWKLGESLHRTNSDGRDAFVFLNNPTPATAERSSEKIKSFGEVREKVKGKKKIETSSLSAYMKSRAKKEDVQRRSYLPYRPELFGFFTNLTGGGLSRNVHPY